MDNQLDEIQTIIDRALDAIQSGDLSAIETLELSQNVLSAIIEIAMIGASPERTEELRKLWRELGEGDGRT